MVMRHSADEVAFRCTTCEPAGLSVQLPLDAPAFGALVGEVRRPSAIRARVTEWARSYWLAGGTTPSPMPCVRCGREVAPRTYVREDTTAWASRHGWYSECDACGQQVSASVAGLALALREVREARRSEPRLRLLPARDVERDGQPAKVVEVATPQGRPVVGAVFLAGSLRLVHVE
jgi:hypothetical protein